MLKNPLQFLSLDEIFQLIIAGKSAIAFRFLVTQFVNYRISSSVALADAALA